MLERDQVPRSQEKSARETSQWIERLTAGPQKIVSEPEMNVSNRFPYSRLPETLNFFRVPVPTDWIHARFESFTYPVYPYRDMIATFASAKDIEKHLPHGHVANRTCQIQLSALFNGEPRSMPELGWSDIARMLSYLIRTGWDSAMGLKRLLPYEMTNGKKAWYLPAGYSLDDKAYFTGTDGEKHWRKLVGKSEKQHVYWHFSLEARPFISRKPYLVLKPHVAFSEDGKAKLLNDKRMHRLRRSFCKNWWNPRWRDLMLAYTARLANQKGVIEVPAGSQQMIAISPMPLYFEGPVSVSGVSSARCTGDETDVQLDELAEEPDWECDDISKSDDDDEKGDSSEDEE